jgi:hypothetical protein
LGPEADVVRRDQRPTLIDDTIEGEERARGERIVEHRWGTRPIDTRRAVSESDHWPGFHGGLSRFDDERARHGWHAIGPSGGVQDSPSARVVGNGAGEGLGPHEPARLVGYLVRCVVERVDDRLSLVEERAHASEHERNDHDGTEDVANATEPTGFGRFLSQRAEAVAIVEARPCEPQTEKDQSGAEHYCDHEHGDARPTQREHAEHEGRSTADHVGQAFVGGCPLPGDDVEDAAHDEGDPDHGRERPRRDVGPRQQDNTDREPQHSGEHRRPPSRLPVVPEGPCPVERRLGGGASRTGSRPGARAPPGDGSQQAPHEDPVTAGAGDPAGPCHRC